MRPIAILSALLLVGCGDIIGLNGYTDQTEGGPDATADSGTDRSSPADTGSDIADVKQVEACNGNPEDCTNGVDDDCNGQTDCQDTACKAGFVCVPPLPMGWTWASYDADQRPSCANGYGSPVDVEEGLNAPAAMCGCGCTTTQPNCATGNLSFTAGSNGNCNNNTSQNGTAAAGCNPTTPFTTNGDSISVTGPAPSGGSCGANGTKTVPNLTYQHQGRTCALSGSTGAGCMNGNTCAPNPAPFGACVSQKGMQACPTGFSVQHLVGTMLADNRDCTACTCKFNAGTCDGTATFYTDNGCTTSATMVTVDGACHNVANHTYRAYKYSPTTNASCTASNSNPTGGAAFSDLTTVCCAN